MITLSIKLKKFYLYSYFNIIRLFVLIILIISFSLCNSSNSKENNEKQQQLLLSITNTSTDPSPDNNKYSIIVNSHSNGSFPYDLEDPDKKYSLPKYLEEVSGLAYYKKDKILCVQDEKANIYVLNLKKEEIVSKYDFGKDGDYEDIAIVDQTAYVIRNDGRIFEIEDFTKKSRKVKEHKTKLSERNDTEGLTFDKLSNSLLIACKGAPAIDRDNSYEGYKAIYRFDLGEMELDKKPCFLVDLNRLDSYKDDNLFTAFSNRIAKKLQLVESETSFKPSGIAIHPIYGEIYIISNIGKLLIILDRHGKVLDVQDLDIKIFRQPEGICFSPSGDLFISSEGQGGKGYILKFNFQSDE